jgi:asparagine synthase (glutamine-hydrolysing)
MCGIVGIIGPQEDSWISAMNGKIHHRGPDDSGIFRDRNAGVTLAMSRLAIIDLAGGHQPMSTPDGRYTIVFNGEIFNAADLRAELEIEGQTFLSAHSDTEVLLYLMARQGKTALSKLNGMFAFALWDAVKQELLCARDRFGIKPFYFSAAGGRLALASELKSLLTLPWIERSVDRDSLHHYMSLMYVPGVDTAIAGVSRLPGGHWLSWKPAQGMAQGRWWSPQIGQSISMPREEAVQRIRTALEAAVARWATSDVPIGCSLSGGLDSSAIVGLLAQQGHRLRTYSVGFAGKGEERWNELPLARAVAERWGTEHEEIVLDPLSLLDDLIQMVWHLDEPYGGGLPSWSVFKQMSHSVKVGMTGSGGDELFGNYGKWRELEGGWLQRGFGAARTDATSFRKHFFDRYYYLSDVAKKSHVLQYVPVHDDTGGWLYEYGFAREGAVDVRDRCALTDIVTQLPEEFLMMTDRFSMAHSVEARTPFLDNELADLVLGLPSGFRTQRNDLKGLLRDTVADVLPPTLVNAPKRGFVIPLTLWLRSTLRPLVERLLASERLAAQGLFKPDFYARYVQSHLDGRQDNTQVVWAALMFQLWHCVFIEGDGRKPDFNVKDLAA